VKVEEVFRARRGHEVDAADDVFGGIRLAPLGIVEGRPAGEWRRFPMSEFVVEAWAAGD
jgi:hypothetical protein